jgi:hypothetical protein
MEGFFIVRLCSIAAVPDHGSGPEMKPQVDSVVLDVRRKAENLTLATFDEIRRF